MSINSRLCLPFARWTTAHISLKRRKDRKRPIAVTISTTNELTTVIELTKKDAFNLANQLVDIAEQHE